MNSTPSENLTGRTSARNGNSMGAILDISSKSAAGRGRLTKHIANNFDHVTALDVSEDQVNYARSRVDRQNIT